MKGKPLLFIIFLLLAQGARAQEAGRISGTILTEREGKPLPGVNVVIAGTLYGAVTDAAGRFVVDAVGAGRYTLQVNAVGYRSESRQVEVPAGGEVVVDVRLRLPEVALEDLEVIAFRPDLEPVAGLDAVRIRDAGVLDAGVLLRALPGVNVGRRGAFSLHPAVRGLTERQAGLYIDGARWLPGSPYGVGAPLEFFDPRVFESIEVVRGPYALAWGEGNLSALRVETRGAHPSPSPLVSVQAGYTSNRGAFETAGATSGVASGLSYWMQGGYRTGGDYRDGRGRSLPADFRAVEVRGRVGYPVAPSSWLGITAGYQGQRDADAPGRLLDVRSSDAANVSARFQTARAAGWMRAFEATAYWNHLDQALDDRERQEDVQESVVVEAAHAHAGGRLAAQLAPSGSLRLDAGADVSSARYDATRRGPGGETDRIVPDARITRVGFFAGATRAFGRLDASGTVRLDVVRAQAGVAGVPDGAGPGPVDPDATEASFSSALSLSVPLSRVWRLSAGAGSATRTADAVERYGRHLPFPDTHLLTDVAGNPALKPERSTQADVWLEAAYPRLDLRVSGFARRIDDYLTPAPAGLDPDVSRRYVNGRAIFRGVEATAAYALLGEFVSVNASASYSWGRDETLDEPALGVAPLSGSLGWRLQAPADLFFLEGTLRGAAAQHRTAASRGETSTGGYVTADLHLGVSLPGVSRLLVGLDNLTNTTYADHLNAQDPFTRVRLAEPGRTFFVRLRLVR